MRELQTERRAPPQIPTAVVLNNNPEQPTPTFSMPVHENNEPVFLRGSFEPVQQPTTQSPTPPTSESIYAWKEGAPSPFGNIESFIANSQPIAQWGPTDWNYEVNQLVGDIFFNTVNMDGQEVQVITVFHRPHITIQPITANGAELTNTAVGSHQKSWNTADPLGNIESLNAMADRVATSNTIQQPVLLLPTDYFPRGEATYPSGCYQNTYQFPGKTPIINPQGWCLIINDHDFKIGSYDQPDQITAFNSKYAFGVGPLVVFPDGQGSIALAGEDGFWPC